MAVNLFGPSKRGVVICFLLLVIAIAAGCRHSYNTQVNPGVTSLPVPPFSAGCYLYNTAPSGGASPTWNKVNCLSPAKASKFPHPTIGGQTAGAYGLNGPCGGPCATTPNSLITAASVAINFPGTCTWPCLAPINSIVDSGTGRTSFSVQLNTNTFSITCNASSGGGCISGDTGEVQFTYQGDIGPVGGFLGIGVNSGLCIWNVDASKQIYQNSCVGVPYFAGQGNNWWFMGTGSGQTMQVFGGEANGVLWAASCLPWASGQCWSVVGPDTLGLCPNALTSCPWQQVSGSLFGIGNKSNAAFPSGVTMATTIVATACFPPSSYIIGYTPFPPAGTGMIAYNLAALQCAQQQSGLGNPIVNTVQPVVQNLSGTDESNNLIPQITPASSLIEACMEGTCWLTYLASD